MYTVLQIIMVVGHMFNALLSTEHTTPELHAENWLLFEVSILDTVETADESVIDPECNILYTSEWEKKLVTMVTDVNAAIAGGLCGADVAMVITSCDKTHGGGGFHCML